MHIVLNCRRKSTARDKLTRMTFKTGLQRPQSQFHQCFSGDVSSPVTRDVPLLGGATCCHHRRAAFHLLFPPYLQLHARPATRGHCLPRRERLRAPPWLFPSHTDGPSGTKQQVIEVGRLIERSSNDSGRRKVCQ